MNTIDHALRLLDTQQASLGAGLAVLVVAVAVLIVVRGALAGSIRLVPALLIVPAGLVVGAVIVEASYYSWYRHRCVLHHSDIAECSAKGGWLSDERR
jgi:hypothetical protein